MKNLKLSETDEYPFILIGNKNDKIDSPFVEDKDIEQYCSSKNNMPYFSCSAKIGDNVDNAFTKVAEFALNRVNNKNIRISTEKEFLNLNKNKNKSKDKGKENGKNPKPENEAGSCCCICNIF